LANTRSAKKRIRSSARKWERNRQYRSAARTYVRRARNLIELGELDEAEEMARRAVTTLDKAARKGIVHERNAARRKSRLMKALAAAKDEPAAE
jgi:small subunit ribosomal protein S20